MQIDDADSPQVKDWVVKRLEDISDADAEVLADYVLALLRSDEEESQVRASCLENLQDFLRDHTAQFVEDVFAVIKTKSYKPGYDANKVSTNSSKLSQNVATETAPPNAPTGPAGSFGQHQQNSRPGAQQNGSGGGSRKRTFHDREGRDSADPHYGANSGGDRALKQMRRGGAANARGGRHHQQHQGQSFMGGPQQGNVLQMPTPPPGFPPLDPNNPMSAIIAMQAMGFPPMPGFPSFPGQTSPMGQSGSPNSFTPFQPPQKSGERCKDYDNKGFCAKGSMCPHDHGSDHLVVPTSSEEYDPSNASAGFSRSHENSNQNSARGSRGGQNSRGRGPRNRGNHVGSRGSQRAAFSSNAPNFDRSNSSIVVEQIPEDKFSEEAVRQFFSEFGTISSVNMQPYKRLAVVKFDDYNGARSAYDSPKVIFDNRFVKVYWYKADAVNASTAAAAANVSAEDGHGGKQGEDEDMLDPEEFEKRQAEAQRVHEEKTKKLKEAQAAKEELDKRIKAQAEERKRLLEKLAAKGTSPNNANGLSAAANPDSTSDSNRSGTPQEPSKNASATEALRAKLAELEAEAETLGLGPEDPNNPDATSSYNSYAYRGRGGAGRGSRGSFTGYRGRGGGRGSWRGFGAAPGGAVARLDNRPRALRVIPTEDEVDFGATAIDEALRAHLFTIGDFSSITPSSTSGDSGNAEGATNANASANGGVQHGQAEGDANGNANQAQQQQQKKKNTAIVAFPQRYLAEMLLPTPHIPGIGKVRFEWVANSAVPSSSSTASPYDTAFGEGKPSNGAAARGSSKLGATGADALKGIDTPADVLKGIDTATFAIPPSGSAGGDVSAGGMSDFTGGHDAEDLDVDEDRWMR